MTDHAKPSIQTAQADEDASSATHDAPQEPTDDELAAGDRTRDSVDDGVRAANKEAVERGAAQKGEGRVG